MSLDDWTNAINDYNAIGDVEDDMASITIRNLDERLKKRLRVRAAHNGRSMEDEVREILRTVLRSQPTRPRDLAAAIRARFGPLGGVSLPSQQRQPMRPPPDFDS